RADVADPGSQLAPELSLQRDVVLIDVRALEVGVDSLIPEIRQVDSWRTGREAMAETAAAPRPEEPEFVGGEEVPDALDCNGRMEQSEPAAQDGFIVLVEAPGIADARAEVVLVGPDQGVRQAGLIRRQRAAKRNQAGWQQRSHLRIRHHV